jgi:hypothetical protein
MELVVFVVVVVVVMMLIFVMLPDVVNVMVLLNVNVMVIQ